MNPWNVPVFAASARTMAGLEDALAEELRTLGAQNVAPRSRAVVFDSDQETLYRILLHSRLALRVHRILFSGEAANEDALYALVTGWDWSRVLSPEQTFAIDPVVHSQHFKHSHFAALKTKDAVVDRVRKVYGRRPSVDVSHPDYRIQLRIDRDQVELALDASGYSLHKRGYRQRTVTAPLNEVLAAGLLHLAGYTGEQAFADPCCGSGTLAIEAAMLATKTAPGLLWDYPGILHWNDANPALWERLRTAARDAIKTADYPIMASDIEGDAVSIARENAMVVGVANAISMRRRSFQEAIAPAKEGILLTNPPYGERMLPGDLEILYAAFGDALKQHWTGWDAWLFSGNRDAIKRVGLRAHRRYPMWNGAIECRLMGYALYAGTGQVEDAEEEVDPV